MKFRLAFAYAAIFSIVGIHQPYWPLWLQYKGLNPFEIAILTALTFALKIVTTPLISQIADRTGQKKGIIILLSLGMSVGVACFLGINNFYEILVVTVFAFSCWSPLMALLDNITTLEAKKNSFDYGHIRLWGSVTLLIVTSLIGCFIEKKGSIIILPSLLLASIFVLITSIFLPQEPKFYKHYKEVKTLKIFLSSNWFPLFILSTMLIQGSHAALYAFGSISWESHNISSEIVGMLWALSVVAEILFFAFGRHIITKFSEINVITLGGITATIRWFLLACFPADISVIAISQLLHAITFSASHLAAMRFITLYVDDKNSASAQGIYSSVIMGIGIGVFIFVSGPLYTIFNSDVFYIMALISIIGTISSLLLKRCYFRVIK